MTRGKLIGVAALVFAVAVGIGFVWGATGRFAATRELQAANQQLDLAVARGHLLDARVSIYSINFGSASRSLEAAREPIGRAEARFRQTGNLAMAGRLAAATTLIGEAQSLAARMDLGANTKTAAAIDAVSETLGR